MAEDGVCQDVEGVGSDEESRLADPVTRDESRWREISVLSRY